MNARSDITTIIARAAMTLLLLLLTIPQEAMATEFITDLMLIGGSKDEVNTLKSTYQGKGWTVIDQDLNAGAGGDYIYLLYKAEDADTTANLTFISNLYISTSGGTAADNVTYDNYEYHLVPYEGGNHFKSKKGDLNSGCGSSSANIHLYYTKKNITGSSNYKAISSIVFNTTKSGAVGKNGGTTGYDLNSGAGGDYIYMHITKEKAHWWIIEKNGNQQDCVIKGFESTGEKSNVKTIPVIIEGTTVVAIYNNLNLTLFKNLEKIYFSTSNKISEMPSVKDCGYFTQVNTIDNSGNVIKYQLPPSITSLPDNAFNGTKLKDIKMPNVTSVGKYAFYGCNQLPVTDNIRYADTYLVGAVDKSKSQYTIKAGTRFLGEDAFKGCEAFTSINIPNTVTYIGYYAFSDCSSLTSVTIPNSVTNIEEYTFQGCSKLTSVTIPESVTSIGKGAFYSCSSLTSVTIPNSVAIIRRSTFKGCSKLTSVTIPYSVTMIENSAFAGCSSLPSITIPESVGSIGEGAFQACSSLTSVTIENGVTSIGEAAFYNCSSLPSINIPNSVTSIGGSAFKLCSSLTDIYFDGTETQWGKVTKGNDWKFYVASTCKEHWRCTVTFNANGHGTAPSAQTNLWSSESTATVPNAPTASGYVFTGWYTNAACTTKWNFASPVPRDMTLYAGWETELQLADNAANNLTAYNGQKLSVTLKGHTLYKDGTWNTLCLPFAVTDADANDGIPFTGTPLEGATVKTLRSSAFNSRTGMLTLDFVDATAIEPGKPYIVMWAKAEGYVNDNSHNVYQPTFSGVTVSTATADISTVSVDFVGTTSPVTLSAGDRTKLYLGTDSKLYFPSSDVTIGSCRAYFILNDITAGNKLDE